MFYFRLKHVIHVWKAYESTVNSSYLEIILVYPTRRHGKSDSTFENIWDLVVSDLCQLRIFRDLILRFQQKSKARPVSERNRVQKNNFVIYLLSYFDISGSDGNNLEFWNSNRRTNTTGRDMLKFVNLLLFLSLHELKIHEVKDSMSSLEAHILMERKW